jgi:hypothetical protein
MNDIRQALTEWAIFKAKLLAGYPELAETDQALIDSLEGETNITEAIAKVVRSSEEDRVLVTALELRIKEMEQRAHRIGSRALQKREIAAKAMTECGLRRVDAPDFSASMVSSPPAVVVTDEAALPDELLIHPPPKPDKREIGRRLKSGETVMGAVLSNAPPHLKVRRL